MTRQNLFQNANDLASKKINQCHLLHEQNKGEHSSDYSRLREAI